MDMNWFAAIYFSCFMYYLITTIVTLYPCKKNGARGVFGMICLNLALWSMLLFMMSLADSPELAAFYRWVMCFCWNDPLPWIATIFISAPALGLPVFPRMVTRRNC
ncbi:hypothetical protein [Acetobacterium wieringae]|uniref:hypothetical protein n=1 Tax=Acetobacterium wieringae TaxID=52694 RepID=UPI001586615E|nr:hypothetical protein [Acetobacterium wieringae]MEA4804971.1 hypothetical protein [Acetobacterium wieringae]